MSVTEKYSYRQIRSVSVCVCREREREREIKREGELKSYAVLMFNILFNTNKYNPTPTKYMKCTLRGCFGITHQTI